MRAREEEQKTRENEEKIKTERIKKSERSAKLGKSLFIKKKYIRAKQIGSQVTFTNCYFIS